MATRCDLTLSDPSFSSRLYRHYDGGPEDVIADLSRWIPRAYKQLRGSGRRCDAEILAALLVDQSKNESGLPDLVPCRETHEDLAFRYEITLEDDGHFVVEESEMGVIHLFDLR